MFWQQLVGGITLGSLYALVAMGLTLVYGVLRILHVAHAGIYVLGAYVGLLAYRWTQSLSASLAAAMAVCAVAGVALQHLVYRPLLGQPPLVPLIASIGVFILLEDLFRLIFGPNILPLRQADTAGTVHLGPVTLTGTQLLILTVTGVLLLATWWVIARTRIGLAWRAVAQDLEIAQAMGVHLGKAVALNFALGSALAAAAAVLVAAHYNEIYPTMGSVPAYKMLALVVLGGLGSPLGTVAAALVLGVVETLVVAYAGFLLPRDAIAFVALIAILMLRPQGLLAR